ncbi:MAG: DUF3859 domain-containing protein [Pseudomonadota bacterium]
MLQRPYRLAFATLLLTLFACSEQNNMVAEGNKYEYGIFQTSEESDEAAAKYGTAQKSALKDPLFVTPTKTIPAKLNTIFGVLYQFPESTYGTTVKINGTFSFPPEGLTNPNTGDTAYEKKFEADVVVNGNDPVDSLLFQLGQEWEVVPGTWTFTVLMNGEAFIEEQFEVVAL